MPTSVFGLPIAHVSCWIFNCWILGSDDTPLVVVDPGLPTVAGQALELIQSDLGRAVEDVDQVLCTHAHPDHVAGVAPITNRVPASVLLPARCADYLAGERPRTFPLVESTMRFMPVYAEQPFSWRGLADFAKHSKRVGYGRPPELRLDFDPAGFVADQDPISSAPGWQALHVPGHTDDSTAFYHRDSETLIAGDAVVTQDGAAWFNPEWVDLEVARKTEERLRSLPVSHLLPGHGPPIESPDVWRTARRSTDGPTGSGLLARCARRLGRWPA